MFLLAAVLLLWGFTLDTTTDAATCIFGDTMGNKPLPRPWLSVNPVHWMTPGLSTFLVCQGRVRGVAFVLKREDDGYPEMAKTDGFLEAAEPNGFLDLTEPGEEERATFVVHQPGNYSCSYQIHEACAPSEPSDIVTIKEYVIPPPPVLTSSESSTTIPPKTAHRTLVCVAPLSDVEFQLRQGKRELRVPSVSTSPEEVSFYLKLSDMGDHSPFTCRYRLNCMTAWSEDSEPMELMWSDETLSPPVFTAEPSNKILAPGSTVQLRCTAPEAGLRRFGLYLEDPSERSLLQTLRSSGNETIFQLHNLSATDSASYSCMYIELIPPFSGSAPSELVKLTVNGTPPPPKLQALWTDKVPAGHDAVLRCQSKVPGVTMELLRDGNLVPYKILRVLSTSTDLGLSFVGPQHTGNYTCRYTYWVPEPFHSELSNPVELLVEGDI